MGINVQMFLETVRDVWGAHMAEKIKKVKKEIRILGFDDGPFEKKQRGKSVPVVGVVSRGGDFLDGILRTDVEIDGTDSTSRLIKIINKSRHKKQLRVVMFDGITLGGFNIIDINRLYEKIGLPVIVVNRKRPDIKSVRKALKNFKDHKKRWALIEMAGEVKPCDIKAGKKLYYQSVGIDDKTAEKVLRISSTRGFIPEPLRIAHLIAGGIVKGESIGRA